MSITQTDKPKRSHVFFLKLALGVFVLIFAAMIFLNQMKAKGIADFLANKPETASPVTAMTVKLLNGRQSLKRQVLFVRIKGRC